MSTIDAILGDRILQYVATHGVHSLCDYGCGEGGLLAYLAEHNPDLELTGIDFLSRFNIEVQAPGVRFIDRDGDDYARLVGNGRFDMVVSTFALHHFQYPVQELRQLTGIVRQGGYLCFFDHCVDLAERPGVVKALSSHLWEIFDALEGKYHRHHYTLAEAQDLMKAIPVKVLTAEEFRVERTAEQLAQQAEHHLERLTKTRAQVQERYDDFWQSIILPLLDVEIAAIRNYGMNHSKLMWLFARRTG